MLSPRTLRILASLLAGCALFAIPTYWGPPALGAMSSKVVIVPSISIYIIHKFGVAWWLPAAASPRATGVPAMVALRGLFLVGEVGEHACSDERQCDRFTPLFRDPPHFVCPGGVPAIC